eukprot:6196909-Pleurochrysis_carterae.AAC.1
MLGERQPQFLVVGVGNGKLTANEQSKVPTPHSAFSTLAKSETSSIFSSAMTRVDMSSSRCPIVFNANAKQL